MEKNKLILKEISYKNNKCEILKNISLSIAPGQVITLLGNNGVGKSTLLKIIAGLLRPTSGDITVDGYTYDNLSARNLIGFLPAKLPIYHDLTVFNFLNFIANLRKIPKEQINNTIEKVIDKLSLNHIAKTYIHSLSSGMQQCVGIAQTILYKPKWLILDEPFNSLDQNYINIIINLLAKIKPETGIILTTHITSNIKQLCDKFLILDPKGIHCDQNYN